MTPTQQQIDEAVQQLRERLLSCSDMSSHNLELIVAALAAAQEQNKTLRAAQKACEDCDAPTMAKVKEMEKNRKELESQRDGHWIDKWGACKVCDGEIPHGHTENCDLYKMEKELAELRKDKQYLDTILDIDSPFRIVQVDSEGEYLNEPPLWNRELLDSAMNPPNK